jgi:tRNA (guanine26-N2/guanine27-N2)-dimethyltransferase
MASTATTDTSLSASPDAEALTIPEGYRLHSENSAHILLPANADAFLNPVQEFNRDLSVACIRAWGDEMNREKEAKWRANLDKSKGGKKGKKAKCMNMLVSL